MFSFENLKVYPGGWTLDEANSAPLDKSQLDLVQSAVISKDEKYDKLQVEVHYKAGGISYLGLSRDSKLQIGDVVDLSNGIMQRLVKGNDECWKFLEN